MDRECTLFGKFPAAIFKTVDGFRFPKSRLQTFPKGRPPYNENYFKDIWCGGEGQKIYIYEEPLRNLFETRPTNRSCKYSGVKSRVQLLTILSGLTSRV